MANYREKKKEIQYLVDTFNEEILEVKIDEGDSIFFRAKNFEPPSIGSVQSAPYLTFDGIDISDFLDSFIFNSDSDRIKVNFYNLLEKEKSRKYQFSDKHTWRLYN